MEPLKKLKDLKQYLARLAGIGVAACYRGVIVSSELYAALKEDNEHFADKIRVTGVEGNRQVRYTFYVMENPNWPVVASDSYFLTPHPADFYREHYLGREDQVFRKSTKEKAVTTYLIKEIEPIDGEARVSSARRSYTVHHAPFEELVKALEEIASQNGSIPEFLARLDYTRGLYSNPPETVWIGKPESYDYHHADLPNSVGRLLMRSTTNTGELTKFEIVGIAINGYGQVVEILKPNSKTDDALVFAKLALRNFLPEEIVLFLNEHGATIKQEDVDSMLVEEWWGSRYDSEDLGRLHMWIGDGHSMSAYFTDSRDGWSSLEFVRTESDEEWEQIRLAHFPKNWTNWSETSHDRAMATFAKSL